MLDRHLLSLVPAIYIQDNGVSESWRQKTCIKKPSCRHGFVVKDKEDRLSRVQERVLMAELAASHHRRREGKLKTAMVAQSSCDLQSVRHSMYCFLIRDQETLMRAALVYGAIC